MLHRKLLRTVKHNAPFINTLDPLTRSLIAYYVPTNFKFLNLCGGEDLYLTGTNLNSFFSDGPRAGMTSIAGNSGNTGTYTGRLVSRDDLVKDGYTFAVWIFPQTATSQIFGYGNIGLTSTVSAELQTGPVIRMITNGTALSTPVYSLLNTWSHIAVTAGNIGNTMKIYINGILAAESAALAANLGTLTNPALTIGTRSVNNATRNYQGKTSEMGVWLRQLSAGEIFQVYQNGERMFNKMANFNSLLSGTPRLGKSPFFTFIKSTK